MKEKDMYVPIQNWLSKRGYVVNEEWINKGAAKYRVDVIGVRSTGSVRQDDIEVVAVEAKVWGNLTSLGQVENYKDFAHKVYFATANEWIVDRYKDDCFRRKVGMLLVKSRRVLEIIAAPSENPRSEPLMAELLGNLYIVRCTLCQCYFDLWDEWDGTIYFPRHAQFKKSSTRIDRCLCEACKEQIIKMRSKEE